MTPEIEAAALAWIEAEKRNEAAGAAWATAELERSLAEVALAEAITALADIVKPSADREVLIEAGGALLVVSMGAFHARVRRVTRLPA